MGYTYRTWNCSNGLHSHENQIHMKEWSAPQWKQANEAKPKPKQWINNNDHIM